MAPYEHAVLTVLLRNGPPKSTFEQSFDHVAVITEADIGLDFGGKGMGLADIEFEIDIMGNHYLPEELVVAFDSFLIDGIKFLTIVQINVGHSLVQVLLMAYLEHLLAGGH